MSDITRNNPAYAEIINKLPKPYSPEEQYLYSIACTVAEVPYEMPFQNAFWRKEQYLKAIWQIAIEKIQEPNIPDDGTVSAEKIIDGAVTEIKLATDVVDRLLADNRITTAMLKDDIISTEKIIDKAVTENKLSEEVTNKLLADNRITTAMLKDSAVTTPKIADKAVSTNKIADSSITGTKLATEITARLLAENHAGIIRQGTISQITETSNSLTLDVVKNKINEIITALQNAEVIS